VPKLLVWDNVPPHHPKRVQATATAAHIQLVFLPFRGPRADALRRPLAADQSRGRRQPRLRDGPRASRARGRAGSPR